LSPAASPPAAPPTTPGEQATPQRTFSDGWSGAGKFADEDPLPLWFWLFGRSPRRSILPALGISVIGPAVNLWGSGSFLLSLLPEASRERKLDTFYPVSSRALYPYSTGRLDYGPGFKRYVDQASSPNGLQKKPRFEFRYPAEYVQDQTVFLANADRAYQQRVQDPQGIFSNPTPTRRSGPEVAFGPAGQTGEENLSIVLGRVQPGFTLRGALGSPVEGAERLIQATIAKPGLREVRLIDACERASAQSGRPLYQFEYEVTYPGLNGRQPTYTICVVGVVDQELVTFASRVPAAVWPDKQAALREAASSFALL